MILSNNRKKNRANYIKMSIEILEDLIEEKKLKKYFHLYEMNGKWNVSHGLIENYAKMR